MTMFFIACMIITARPGKTQAAPPEPLHPWQIFELTLSAAQELPDAYRQRLPEGSGGGAIAKVTFSGVSGAAQGRHITVPVFWDGGRQWKVRFAPPVPGHWSYATQATDPELAKTKGELVVAEWSEAEKEANPLRRGFIRVASQGPRAGRYFTYGDGSPFLWLGDTWWDWSKPGVKFESFKNLADDRAAKGFTVGQLRFNSGKIGGYRPGQ